MDSSEEYESEEENSEVEENINREDPAKIEDFVGENINEPHIQEERKSIQSNNIDYLNNQQRKESQNIEMTNLNLNKEDDIQITNINEEENNKIPLESLLDRPKNKQNLKEEEEKVVKSRRKISGEMHDIAPYIEKIEKKRKKKENAPEGPIK